MGRDSIQIEDLLDALNGNIVTSYDRTKSRKFIRFMMKVSQLPLEFRNNYKQLTEIIPVETMINQLKRIIKLENFVRFGKRGAAGQGVKMYIQLIKEMNVYESCTI